MLQFPRVLVGKPCNHRWSRPQYWVTIFSFEPSKVFCFRTKTTTWTSRCAETNVRMEYWHRIIRSKKKNHTSMSCFHLLHQTLLWQWEEANWTLVSFMPFLTAIKSVLFVSYNPSQFTKPQRLHSTCRIHIVIWLSWNVYRLFNPGTRVYSRYESATYSDLPCCV